MSFTRRHFLQSLGAGAVLLATGFPGLGRAAGRKIVILGAGFGGSTAAKYLKMLDPSLQVTLVDRAAAHVSCVMSNEVIVGMRDISSITLPHKTVADKYGVTFVQAEIQGLDATRKTVRTSAGDLAYDKLIVSPGIAMDYDEKQGFDAEMRQSVPHAWIGGPQTLQLRDMLANAKKGDTLLIRTPKVIYRCPPGPYERICLISDFARQRGCSVVALDPNPGIASKAPLFRAALEFRESV